MFIVSDKCHCCNNTFTDVRFSSLLAKNTNYFYAVRISILLAVLSEIFKLVTFLTVMQENNCGCFFLNTVYNAMDTATEAHR